MSAVELRRWRVVVPVKGGYGAKSRLAASLALPVELLAAALAQDTVAAALASGVGAVGVVTADPTVADWAAELDTVVLRDPGGGLDAAVGAGLRWAGRTAGPVAVLLGDHPALRPQELAEALVAAAAHPTAYVADHERAGTALLCGLEAGLVRPSFGPGSAARHAATGAMALDGAWPGLRTDVDVDTDLERVLALGVGPRTGAVLGG